ncbi:MAG TPA: S53 family peptidase [Terriglobales bacterium]|nr:S53 family peptidase [Terriglobales bacterium]
MRLHRFTPLVALLLFVSNSLFAAQPTRDRIVAPIDNNKVAVLKGDVMPRTRIAVDRGAVSATFPVQRMLISFKRTAEQENNLATLLGQLQNPASPKYHQWLTPEQFADQFGLSASDYAKVVAWLQSSGFKIAGIANSRTWIAFDGTAAQVSAVFHTQIHQYESNGKLRYANATEPSIPAALANVVLGVRIHNFKPRARSRRLKPSFTSTQTNLHFLAPDDFATIYDLHGLYSAGIDGTGQKIAVMGQTKVDYSNVTTFRQLANLPPMTVTDIITSGSAASNSGDLDEAYLDIEWSGAIARNAQIIYVHTDGQNTSGAFDSLSYAIDHNTAPVISISYGDCEPNFSSSDLTTIAGWLQQANAQGQTVVTPSGDDGAADCDYPASSTASVTSATHGLAVDVPSSFPYSTAVGGTTFNEGTGDYWNTTNNSVYGTAKSYIPEVVWNDTLADLNAPTGPYSFAASGGGKSRLFTKPIWQTGIGVPSEDARFVPDIALAASVDHDGYLTCTPGFCVNPTSFPDGWRDSNNKNLSVVGGTSVGVPAFAGMVALINQKKGGRQGNINPALYALSASLPGAFHDVVSGDNKVPCTTGTTDCASGGTIGFTSGTGYDPTTGLGSPDASTLVNNIADSVPAADFTILNTAPNITVTHGTTGTALLNFYAESGFSGSVNLTCSVSSSLGSSTCALKNSVGNTISSVTPNAAVTVSIKASSSLASNRTPRLPFAVETTLATLFGAVFISGKNSRRRWIVLTTLAIFALLLTMVACGGSSSTSGGGGKSTSPVAGTVTIQAIGGGITHSSVINVTVD